MGSLYLVTDAAMEPVTLAEAKAQLRVTDDNSNTDITAMIKAARRAVENYIGQILIQQTWDWSQDDSSDPVTIPLYPLVSATPYVTDLSDVEAAESSDIYVVDTAHRPGRVFLKSGSSWTVTRGISGFRVRFAVGWGSTPADIPQDFKSAILAIVAFLFEHRGDDSVNKAFTETDTSDSLVRLVPAAAMFLSGYRTSGRLLG